MTMLDQNSRWLKPGRRDAADGLCIETVIETKVFFSEEQKQKTFIGLSRFYAARVNNNRAIGL
jgi:hypothetical protein